jgi:Lrp/AsnC family leucine-responsive transcriptional regulator
MQYELDDFDLCLIDAIQRNNRLTVGELAEKVCLSPSSVQRRLRRLREHKIIHAEVALVSPETLGRGLTSIVEVSLDTDRAEVIEDFARAILAAPEVMQAYYVTGNADFVLVITARDMADYEQFADRFFSKNRHVKHFRTSVVMRRIKWGLAVPVKTSC